LHGNPLTHVSWHKVAPRLAQEFTVVATDLRGYGDSAKPPGGEKSIGYSFRAMAEDQLGGDAARSASPASRSAATTAAGASPTAWRSTTRTRSSACASSTSCPPIT
jgi:hypothetical protein